MVVFHFLYRLLVPHLYTSGYVNVNVSASLIIIFIYTYKNSVNFYLVIYHSISISIKSNLIFSLVNNVIA